MKCTVLLYFSMKFPFVSINSREGCISEKENQASLFLFRSICTIFVTIPTV